MDAMHYYIWGELSYRQDQGLETNQAGWQNEGDRGT